MMTAKEYSLRIETLLRKINDDMYGESDNILLDPYGEIISAVEYRVSKNKLENFKIFYEAINGKTIQELINLGYNIECLIEDIKMLVHSN